ncbi:hypothetical protein VTJ49DRAFT_7148 [Mycothermus thermophilus]|uniref:Uncharacterized protein n=1 Tax=Humicola insolens TaxID=85995 RepID=A0ABR3VHU9_HUMIN
MLAKRGTLVPPWYHASDTTLTGLLVAAFFYGASVAVAAFVSAKAVRQLTKRWRHNRRAKFYIVMILANRLSLIMYNPSRERWLKVSLAVAIGIINVSVFIVWIPARLQISPEWVFANEVWDRTEKAIYAVIDMALNVYFMWLVKTKLVAGGLKQYTVLWKYNVVMVCLSISLDIMLIGMMSLPDDAVYVQVHPLVYLTKLNIEINMANLIGKVVKRSTESHSNIPSADVWRPHLAQCTFDHEWLGTAKNFMVSPPTRGGGGGGGGGGNPGQDDIDLEACGNTKNTATHHDATRPRSSTKGPLDDDPGLHPTSGPVSGSAPRSTSPAMSMSRSPVRSPAPHVTGKRIPSSAPSTPRLGPKDFSFLLRPEIYHPLTQANVPPPFRNPPDPPPAPDTPIDELIAHGHFRAAAIAAARALTSPPGDDTTPEGPLDPTDHRRIFHLFYTRLACLTLIDATPLAAQEVKALGDLHSAFYYYSPTPTHPPADDGGSTTKQKSGPPQQQQQQQHLVPWPLRVLAIRLQALGFGDPRRAVMSYYELAREARTRLAAAVAAEAEAEAAVWRERLVDLGVRVAGALAEMDDLAGAVEHLRTLPRGSGAGSSGGMERMREALLWLQLGDVQAARACLALEACPGGDDDAAEGGAEGRRDVAERVVDALCDMADGEYETALGKWTALREEQAGKEDEMGRVLLEEMVEAGRSSHTLLFNLSTMYELCTDRSRGLKARLAEKVALNGDRTAGWEKTNADFKL